jgi:hypothetical protein
MEKVREFRSSDSSFAFHANVCVCDARVKLGTITDACWHMAIPASETDEKAGTTRRASRRASEAFGP